MISKHIKTGMISKNCEHCNKKFITNHKLKKHCDMTCQVKAKEARINAKKREITRLKKYTKKVDIASLMITNDVPDEIVAKHPSISSLAMSNMLKYFKEYNSQEYENLLVPFASDTGSVQKYTEVFQRIFNCLTNELGKDGMAFKSAIVTVHWMQGRPISRIIQERQKALKKTEEIHITIRSVLNDIESIARYKAPKFLSCYNDLLKYFFLQTDNIQLANEIVDDIALYLEMGVNTKTQLSLLNLGLSRTSAVEIKEFIISDELSENECIAWLMNPNNNWMSFEMSKMVKREIAKILKIHT